MQGKGGTHVQTQINEWGFVPWVSEWNVSFISLAQPTYITVLLEEFCEIGNFWEPCVLLRHNIIEIDPVRAISCFVLLSLITNLVIGIRYSVGNLRPASQIPMMGPLRWLFQIGQNFSCSSLVLGLCVSGTFLSCFGLLGPRSTLKHTPFYKNIIFHFCRQGGLSPDKQLIPALLVTGFKACPF